MNNKSVNLNLLVVAAALFRTKNVSKAAQELALSQSAVSHALSRLRDQFRDPMFVRTSKGVMPTEFARSIQSELMELVRRAELISAKKTKFDPAEVKTRITLATTDYFECVIMPRLEPLLAQEAPGVQISIRPTAGELPKRELEEGKIDFAIAGFYQDLPEGFFQAKLFSDRFKCATKRNHPHIRGRMTVDEYFKARHALITLQGDFREEALHSSGKSKYLREIVYGSYSFTGIAWVLSRSDLVLTAPSLLIRQYQEFFPVQVLDCPIHLDPIQVRMVWHAQTHQDPIRQWFRAKLKEVCKEP